MTEIKKRGRRKEGQVMFLTVVVLGAIIASVTTIAGLLMSYQIKRSADIASSQKAIFAADAGVECMMYQLFSVGVAGGQEAKGACGGDGALSNGAYFEILVEPNKEKTFPNSFISTGYYGSSVRSMQIKFIKV
ncbi:MAG: hypothetical protein A2430_00205 [Candidatus Liptonbacteria bacterium RIFOXYC1_FULL_36_8]|uniref:Type 4 fimbrial biogenesis protein PilX N-terminal domain-containing protein n=3 Tax=Candidatus Liptoniibacteriota TaxID=1817909 RepID=A0A1G2CNP8_9BACT|nr:MAG: hypothetical protein A2390_01205 [Candidatus Liptonbacteria bacterium RIFOXYB1_FULL_36_10]OGZ03032.1 MAG: hypothetical protein A2604_00970 [Candidatus Liptonbacteria bacterium RIFOXYD1_FULL_36_11]OGZ03057.1 MAG: hypothetical protein A2430_00205 [Candidatus Liptonbacteria bacterium RIFOXYC1_FULL_36_8]